MNIVKKNLLEDMHSMFEKYGEDLLKINSQKDLLVLTDSSVISVLPESLLKIIAITFAITLAANLTFSYNLNITLLKNSSNIEFITTDQPIINQIQTDDLKNNKDELLELYYPIGPEKALLLCISDESLREEYELKMDPEVESYNNLLLDLQPDFVFSQSEESLKQIMIKYII